MATKLDLTLTATPTEGNHALICLVGSKGALIPKLDKDLAAAVISAILTARFTGEAGKSVTLNLKARTVVLVGTGDSLDQGLEAETTGGKIFAAVGALQVKRAVMPDHGLQDLSLIHI